MRWSNVLQLAVVMLAQLCECMRPTELHTLKGWTVCIVRHVSYIQYVGLGGRERKISFSWSQFPFPHPESSDATPPFKVLFVTRHWAFRFPTYNFFETSAALNLLFLLPGTSFPPSLLWPIPGCSLGLGVEVTPPSVQSFLTFQPETKAPQCPPTARWAHHYIVTICQPRRTLKTKSQTTGTISFHCNGRKH